MGLRVIGIGDNVCDKYLPAMMMYPGGQAMNFSVYANMLGADSAYMGVFGTDEVAAHIQKTLDELGIDRSRCRQYPGENGYAKVQILNGDREFLMSNRGGVVNEHPLELDEEDLDYIRTFQLVHTSNNGHFDSQLPKIKACKIPLSYDFSGHWNESYYLETVAPHVTYAFFSCGSAPEEEVKEACRTMISKGCRIAAATRGSLGSMIYDGSEFYVQPPKPVEALDTLGAGDSFATAFLLTFLEQGDLKAAMKAGADFASKTCLVNGAFGHGIPFVE